MRSEASAAYRIPRREFLTTVMRAGAGFALMAAFGRSIRIGSAQGCGPVSPVNQICADGQTEQEARDKLAAATDAACDTLCEGLGGCAKGSKCLRSGLAAYNAPSECSPNARGGVTCCVRVTCPCACFSCDDVVPADTLAIGTGDNKGDAWSAMLADAKNKCEAFCKKVDSCPDKKPTCRLNGTAKVKAKQADDCKQDPITHKWTCKGTIEKCPCKCGK
jgi:hypothetical protein